MSREEIAAMLKWLGSLAKQAPCGEETFTKILVPDSQIRKCLNKRELKIYNSKRSFSEKALKIVQGMEKKGENAEV